MTVSGSPPPQPEHGVAGELRQDRFVGTKDLASWPTRFGQLLASLARPIGGWIGPHAALVVILVVGMAAVVALSAVAAQVYDAVTEADGVAGLDQPLLAAAMSARVPWLNYAATGFTDVAGVIVMPIVAVVVMMILALRRRSWTPVILITAAGAGSLLMTIAGKRLIGRARPPLADAIPPYEHSASFPSGHTLNAVVIAGVIAYLLVLRQRHRTSRVVTITVAVAFAVTIGATRVYLGHHWFTDVLAAACLGAAWLALVITAHRLYLTTRKSHAPAPAQITDTDRPKSRQTE
ncbi:phosphatase PAP2 family protein [Microbacterium deminutum]|uniref:Phosphatidic acid phosphatase type 2/haloperoxidase domain-containing protein n=1 Tax=Microbacterium deminutum TaxID=344164 RepID=A0ABN2R1W9_9MICO